MATSDVDICSRALIRLGASTINALTESTTAANLYPEIKEHVLTLHPWRRTMGKVRLVRDSTNPISEWSYNYTLPSDRLGNIRGAFPTDAANAKPLLAYEIFGNNLQTNSEKVFVDYQKDITVGEMPPYLIELMILACAEAFAIPITDSESKAEYFGIKAWGTPSENGRGGFFRVARTLDSQSQPPQRIEDFSLLDARFS